MSTRRRRAQREGEGICSCSAYDFPHRQFGGACDILFWVERFFEPRRLACNGCLNLDGRECQVVSGLEAPPHCPEWREYVRVEGIKLYGKAKAALDRAQGR